MSTQREFDLNQDALEVTLKSPVARHLLRFFLNRADTTSPELFAQYFQISDLNVRLQIEQLVELGILAAVTSSEEEGWQLAPSYCEEREQREQIEQALWEGEQQWIAERAKSYKIDVVGRLEWIDDAYTMIQHAKKDLTR